MMGFKISQGILAFVGPGDYIAAMAAITAVGTAEFPKFFMQKRDNAVAPIPCFNRNRGFITKNLGLLT